MASNDLEQAQAQTDKEEILTVCRECGWLEGAAREPGQHRDVTRGLCPECEAALSLSAAVDPGQLSSEQTEALGRVALRLESRRSHMDRFEQQMLKDVGQLPDIDGPGFSLRWDVRIPQVGEAHTEVQLGARVIWSELAHWGDHERFGAIAAILSEKYGDRLEDLVPTRRAETILYGESLGALRYVDAVRRELRDRYRNLRVRSASGPG